MTSPLSNYKSYLGLGDFSDIYLEESASLALRWEDGKIESVIGNEEGGAGLRYLKNLETRYGHTDLSQALTGPASRDELEKLQRLRRVLGEGLPELTVSDPAPHSKKQHSISISPQHISLEQKMTMLERAYRAVQNSPYVRQITINYGEKIKNISYYNSLGETFSEERIYTVFSMTVTTERDRNLQTAYDSMGGVIGWELFEGDRVEKLAKEIAERARLKLDAPPAPVGPMPVIIASSAGGTLIHEAIGHSLEADAVLEGTSPAYRGKLGQVVGNSKLNVFDDPTVPSKRGSFYFDDEGTPSERTHLVKDGVLSNYLYDRLSARRGDVKSNGHGRRESYAHVPIPRMSNTFVAPGKDDPQKIIDNFQNGLLVTRMGGGQVNTANGDFVFEVEEGFAVKDGKKTMVRGATLLGNGPQVLMDIDEVGSDHGWAIGTCGKEGQGVPVSDAMPTIKIKSLVIGGGQ